MIASVKSHLCKIDRKIAARYSFGVSNATGSSLGNRPPSRGSCLCRYPKCGRQHRSPCPSAFFAGPLPRSQLKSDCCAEIAGGGEIRITDQTIDVGGDMAVETGVETGELVIAGHAASIHHRVTNVYRKGADGWRLQHHHADLSPAMLENTPKAKRCLIRAH
ncbi:nuclear transport factor 2 family protein [Bauldia litoralis]